MSGYFLPASESITVPYGNGTMLIRAAGQDTGGSFSLLECVILPKRGPRVHKHRDTDEAFYILEGELTVQVENDIRKMPTGSFIFVPRGKFHTWVNDTPQPVKLLIQFTPAGPEAFFVERAQLYPLDRPQPEWNVLRKLMEKYGWEFE